MRENPWSAMKRALIDKPKDVQNSFQRIMVISGMGGSGKTQLARKFAQNYKFRYQYICFIDGSSVASIEEDLVASILSIDRQQGQMTLEQALQWFVRKQNWLIVFDNVDSPLDIRSFFPQCNHGSILITTRNRTLGQVSPDTHYRLRGMTNEEAKKALLLIALPPGTIASPLDLKYAQDIVAELGNLPVAIVHAGRFILERNCLAQYLTHFRASRAEMLSRPAHYKVDDYHKSVYAALETIRSELSNQSLKALHLFSYFHYTNIPHITIRKATESRYSFEIANYLDRSLESSPAAVLLTDILGNVEKLGEILIGLQARSLVEMDWVSGQKVIRLHPVVQTWAQDELMFEDAQTYREAVVRILSTCAGKEDRFIHRFLLPHIRKLSPYWSSMHPNDKAAFAAVLWAYSPNRSIQLLEEVHERVKLSSKMDELAYAGLLLKLGKGYYHTGNFHEVESLNKKAVEIRKRILSPLHPDTIKAQCHLGYIYFIMGRYTDARKQHEDVLRRYKQTLGELHPDTITASAKLALTLAQLGRLTEAKDLQEEALRRRTKILTEKHPDTLTSMSNLARTYALLGRHVDAESLRERVVHLRREVLGEYHMDTIISEENLAVTYHLQGLYDKARKLQESTLQRYQTFLEPSHYQIAIGKSYLAQTYYELDMLFESETIARQAEEILCHSFAPGNMHYERPKTVLRKIRWKRRMNVLNPIILWVCMISCASVLFLCRKYTV